MIAIGFSLRLWPLRVAQVVGRCLDLSSLSRWNSAPFSGLTGYQSHRLLDALGNLIGAILMQNQSRGAALTVRLECELRIDSYMENDAKPDREA